MPPRYSYWTIIAGGLPTAFRATEREELLPTFKRIQEKHPDAQMKYFARGKLWDSRDAAEASRTRPDDRRPPSGSGPSDRRGRDWRPGGEHRDPRQGFIDAKKKRNIDRRQDRFDRKERSAGDQTWRDRPPRDKPRDKPRDDKNARPDWRDRPPRSGPPQDRFRKDTRPTGPPKDSWRDRPPRDKPRDKPRDDKNARPDWRDRPPRSGPPQDRFRKDTRPAGPSKDSWRDRPPRDKPRDKPRDDKNARPDWRDRPPKSGPPQDRFRKDTRPSGPPKDSWRDRPPKSGPGKDRFGKDGRPSGRPPGRPPGDRRRRS